MSYEFLRPVLGDELYAQVDEKLSGSELNIINLSDGSYIPKAKFDDERKKNKTLNESIADLTKQLGEAQDQINSAASLQTQVDKLTKDLADKDAAMASTTKQYRIKDELRGMKAKNVDVIMPLLNLDKITDKDGKLAGLSEQVDALKQSDAYLFEIAGNRGGFGGSQDIGGSNETPNAAMNAAIRSASGRHN